MHRGDIDRPRRRGRAAYGSAIKAARTARGETQDVLAPLLGISQATLSKLERGVQEPTAHTRSRIAAVLGPEVDALHAAPRRRRRKANPVPVAA